MPEYKTEHFERIAELVAEVTVRRLSAEEIKPMRDEMKKMSNEVTELKAAIFDGGTGGLINEVKAIQVNCVKKHDVLTHMLAKPAGAVRKWAYTLAGITIGGGLVVALIELHKIL